MTTTISDSTGLFPRFQPKYAAHGIATFPVRITDETKKPEVKHFQKIGLRYSAQLAARPQFANADAFGYIAGAYTKKTVLDIDSKDEKVLSAALDRHGPTPVIVRTGSGKFHALYRHNGERRLIKPWRGLPIDLLGGGLVVAPPSTTAKGSYEFIQGSLADLDHLPVLRNLDFEKSTKTFKQGGRNIALFRHCMRAAHHVDCFDDLLNVARTFNEDCEPPMEDNEVMTTAESAWAYTERGQNRFGQHGAWMAANEIDQMISNDQDALVLLSFLRRHQGPAATFMCANGLAETFGWHRIRLANARRRLIELGHFKPIRQAARGFPAMFKWT